MLPVYLVSQSEPLEGGLDNSSKRGSSIGIDLLFIGRPLPIAQGSINIFDRPYLAAKYSREPASIPTFDCEASVVITTASTFTTSITMATGGSPILQTSKARASSIGYDFLFAGRPLPAPDGTIVQLDRYQLSGKYSRDFSSSLFPTAEITTTANLELVNNLPVGSASLSINTLAVLTAGLPMTASALLEIIASGTLVSNLVGVASLVVTGTGTLVFGDPVPGGGRSGGQVIYCPRCNTIEVVDQFSPRCRCRNTGRSGRSRLWR